jgi:hypothetical protein
MMASSCAPTQDTGKKPGLLARFKGSNARSAPFFWVCVGMATALPCKRQCFRFFALLGSGICAASSKSQMPNTARPEAELTFWKLHARNPNRFFITPLLSRHSIRE